MFIAEQIKCLIPSSNAVKEGALYCAAGATNATEIWTVIGTFIAAFAAAFAAFMARNAWKTARDHLEHTQHEDHMTRVYSSTTELISSLRALTRRDAESIANARITRDEAYTVAINFRLTSAQHLDYEEWRWIVLWMLRLANLRNRHLLSKERASPDFPDGDGMDHRHALAFSAGYHFEVHLGMYAEAESKRNQNGDRQPYDLIGNLKSAMLETFSKHPIKNDTELNESIVELGSLKDGPNPELVH